MCSLPDIEGRCDKVDELIWRSDAIKAITGEPIDAHYPSWYVDKLKEVPPVEKKVVIKMDAVATGITFTPNKHVGKWKSIDVYKVLCSVCKQVSAYEHKYCPNCGAKMEEDE